MSCPICGGTMVGDGVTALRHCEFARDEDIEGKEPDAGPVYCVALVTKTDRSAAAMKGWELRRYRDDSHSRKSDRLSAYN